MKKTQRMNPLQVARTQELAARTLENHELSTVIGGLGGSGTVSVASLPIVRP